MYASVVIYVLMSKLYIHKAIRFNSHTQTIEMYLPNEINYRRFNSKFEFSSVR